MGEPPPCDSTCASASVLESGQPIYDAAQLCSDYFQHIIKGGESSAEGYAAIEDLGGQFNQWVAYVGAFAVPRASLDARLAPHEDIKDMVLDLLYMVEDNLRWVNIDDAGEDDSEIRPGIPAIRAAMDRLFILAINLRRPTCRKYRLAQEPADEQAERLASLLVKRRYPNARKSLCNQLGASINIRGKSLLYLKKHNRNLASFRSGEYVAEEPTYLDGGYKDELSVPTMSGRRKRQKVMKQPETLASSLSPSMRHRVLQESRNPPSSIISRGSVIQSNEYDYPPQPEQKEGASYQSCILCDAPLNPKSLTPRAWRIHVDQDLEPYVCISEDCMDPPQYFKSEGDWMDHMQNRHSLHWSENIHTKRWYCDYSHPGQITKPLEFDEETEFVNHLKTDHAGDFTQPKIQGLVIRNRWTAKRDPFVCPLCDCVPDDIQQRIKEKPFMILWQHIATHLKSLGFLSLSYAEDNREDDAIVSNSSGIGSKEKYNPSRSTINSRDLDGLENITGTMVDSNREQAEWTDHSEQSTGESENWDFLPVKSLRTDWEELKRHLTRLSRPITQIWTCHCCSYEWSYDTTPSCHNCQHPKCGVCSVYPLIAREDRQEY